MSFGFSVGDFIAVGSLIKDISSCLQDAGGSKTEYQELLRELECLQQALHHLDKLQNGGSSSTNLDSIDQASAVGALLNNFRSSEVTHLGVWRKDGFIKIVQTDCDGDSVKKKRPESSRTT